MSYSYDGEVLEDYQKSLATYIITDKALKVSATWSMDNDCITELVADCLMCTFQIYDCVYKHSGHCVMQTPCIIAHQRLYTAILFYYNFNIYATILSKIRPLKLILAQWWLLQTDSSVLYGVQNCSINPLLFQYRFQEAVHSSVWSQTGYGTHSNRKSSCL